MGSSGRFLASQEGAALSSKTPRPGKTGGWGENPKPKPHSALPSRDSWSGWLRGKDMQRKPSSTFAQDRGNFFVCPLWRKRFTQILLMETETYHRAVVVHITLLMSLSRKGIS